MGLLQLYFALSAVGLSCGLGVDPALHVDLLQELDLLRSSGGIVQVQGFHNQSRAFLFEGSSRMVRCSPKATEQILQKMRGRTEFTFLLTFKQEKFSSGVLLSIHSGDQRFLEVESSGLRHEVRLFFQASEQREQREVFSYSLADGHWHRVSVTFSASHVLLHIDCNRVYERIVEVPVMEFPVGTSVWLGQRNDAHGFFRGVMQDVQLAMVPHGYVIQCPDLNRTCPTCNDFHGLVQKIMELQDILAKTSTKLTLAEEKMKYLDSCYCERTCRLNGETYRDEDAWIDGCRNCTCSNGTVECESVFCPAPKCPPDSAPVYMPGSCCKECQPVCVFRGRVYAHAHRQSVRDPEGSCVLFQCRDGSMRREESTSCPELSCPESQQIELADRCCRVCRGHDFCSEALGQTCVENSECVNLEGGAACRCKEGFHALREDHAYCQDVDECAEGKHYCRENTMCLNTLGSFMCVCHSGFVRIDDFSCTERDECVPGLNTCDQHALCFNTVAGHGCRCDPGFVGNGTVCRAVCDGQCLNGGTCVSPDTCVCQQGFTGTHCQTDIDECSDGFVECDSRAVCVNLPGWYHCECRDGYHDSGRFSANGESCEDIDECQTGRHTCANDTLCLNVEGGFDCRCPHGRNCSGDCEHQGRVKHSGQIWLLEEDHCSVCSCQSGLVMCRRMVCDCDNPTVDVLCCPECDPRVTSQCLTQSGLMTYSDGDTWTENCQQCQCMRGEVDCWPVPCPALSDCPFTVVPEGECCPHCVTDPCLGDSVRNDISSTCVDEHGVSRFSGSAWTKHGTECSLCQCKNGHVCCSVDPLCL